MATSSVGSLQIEYGRKILRVGWAADSCSPSAARQAVYARVEAGEIYRTIANARGCGAVAVYALQNEKEEENDEGEI